MTIGRELILKVGIVYSLVVMVSIEILGYFNLINRWAIVALHVGLLVTMWWYLRQHKIVFEKFERLRWTEKFILILLLATILLPLLFVALYFPPSNWDSMTYHLSRVMHWIQNRNVYHFPTNGERQLFMAPGAEYLIMHWRLLLDSDVAVNLVQYMAMLGSVVGSTLVTKKLGGGLKAQVFSAVLVMTIPMGIMQATTTQTDYLAAYFLVCFVYFGIERKVFFWSVSLALGIFTKSTMGIYALPFLLYFGLLWLIDDRRLFGKAFIQSVCLMLIVNSGLWWRNYDYFESISGPVGMTGSTMNYSLEAKYILSNLVRNTAINMATPMEAANRVIDKQVSKIHGSLGLQIDDLTNTFKSYKYQTLFIMNEDFSGNGIMVLILPLVAVGFGIGVVGLSPKQRSYLYSLVLGWILLAVVLKWQPWITRLQLPFFVIGAPLMAVVIGRIRGVYWLMLILVVMSWPWVVGKSVIYTDGLLIPVMTNRTFEKVRQWRDYPREKLYFLSNEILYKQYITLADDVARQGVRDIGLDINGESFEYPLWVVLQRRIPDIRLNYIFKKPRVAGRNFGVRELPKIIIYDSLNTDELIHSSLVDYKKSYGSIKMLVLK